MDDALAGRMKELAGNLIENYKKSGISIRFTDHDGAIEIVYRDRAEPYHLKPLEALYGRANGPSVDEMDGAYMPLLLCIEEEIVRYDQKQEPLTDAAVALALRELSSNPERPSSDELARSIQTVLRLNLSLNDYSRQEVRQALRKIERSVMRHKDGSRGYLEFIREYVGQPG
jgi:hypothetical protein